MAKSLSQITFDFVEPGEAENVQSITPSVIQENIKTQIVEKPADKEKKEEKNEPSWSPVTGKRGRKSLKEISVNADLVQIPEDEILFKKQYYSIGEVATMFRENQSLIRYWETEFDILQPRKNRKGDRFFRPVDIKNLVMIYDLLRRRKFTIEGAKDYLKKNKKAEEKFAMMQSLEKIKGFLLELKANL
ncbi:MAG TPA: MerR family transcriptional regulator [Chitinophagaceae bacterium]|nr:MerR family transcriptional regulator [Chitinophagaceae bacterium]